MRLTKSVFKYLFPIIVILLLLLPATLAIAYSYSASFTVKQDDTIKTLSIYSTVSDGYQTGSDVVYATAQQLAVATATDAAGATANIGQNTGFLVYRSYFFFDTSSIPDGATIDTAVLNLYGETNSSTTDFNFVVQSGMPTYPHDPIVNADFDEDFYNGYGSNLVNTSTFVTTGYNSLTLNAIGLTWINKTGYTKLAVLSEEDEIESSPAGAEYVVVYTSESVGTTKDPQLVVTYHTSVAYDMLPVMVDAPITYLAANDYISATGLDTRVQNLGDTVIYRPHMLADDKILAAVGVPAGAQVNSLFTSGNTAAANTDIVTGYGGYTTIDDDANLEPGGNFRMTFDGYVNTDAGASKTLIDKTGAVSVYVDPAVDHQIDADVTTPTLTLTSTALDGYQQATDGVYLTAQSKANADFTSDAANAMIVGQDATFDVYRGYVYFDTSLLSADAVIDSATLSLYGQLDVSTTDFNIIVQTGMPAHPNDIGIQAADFSAAFYAGTGGVLDTSAFSVVGYNDITLLGPGIGWINKVGTTKFCLRSQEDINASSPAGDEYVQMYTSEEAGKEPKLVIDYHYELTAAGVATGEHTIVLAGGGTEYGIHTEQPSSKDAEIREVTPDTVIDAGVGDIRVASSASPVVLDVRSIIEFDINWGVEVPAGAVILDADLYLYTRVIWDSAGRTYQACKLTRTNWVENQATWNSYSTGNAWTAPGGDYTLFPPMSAVATVPAVLDWMVWDVDSIVTDAQTTGFDVEFLIKDLAEGSATTKYTKFYSKDSGTAALAPKLVISYKDGDTSVRILVDSVLADSDTFAGNTVDDTANDWVLGSIATPYIDYYTHEVTGVEVVRYEPTAIVGNVGESGAVDAGSTTTIDDAILTQADDYWIGARLNIITTTDGLAPQGETSVITDFDSVNDRLTFGALTAAPDVGDTYTIDYGTLVDETGTYDGRITWGVNPAWITASLGGLISSSSLSPSVSDGEEPTDILPSSEVSDWYEDTDTGALANHPLRPFITMLSDTTALTEAQAWQFFGLIFVVFATVLAAVTVRGHLLIAGIACAGAILTMTIWTIWPLWSLVFMVPAILSGLISERTPSV